MTQHSEPQLAILKTNELSSLFFVVIEIPLSFQIFMSEIIALFAVPSFFEFLCHHHNN